MGVNGYTPTHLRMLAVLRDGMPHTRLELFDCLDDELSAMGTVKKHICTLRKLLPKSQTIICELHQRRICYRHICLLPPNDE